LHTLQERFAKKNEASDLLRAFHVIDTKKDDKVDSGELNQLFARLGHKIKRVCWRKKASRLGKLSGHVAQRTSAQSFVTSFDWDHAQSQVDEMIWEVDEDCDHCLTWAEFQSMYHRCNNDKTGVPPPGPADSFHDSMHQDSRGSSWAGQSCQGVIFAHTYGIPQSHKEPPSVRGDNTAIDLSQRETMSR
jgi:Ca2+-binding EF-hand superfamily protein